jgi:hypothetical protein
MKILPFDTTILPNTEEILPSTEKILPAEFSHYRVLIVILAY